MVRLLDISIAITLVVLFLPVLVLMQGLLALNRKSVMLVMRQFQLDKLPLLFRVAKGRMSLREWWEEQRR